VRCEDEEGVLSRLSRIVQSMGRISIHQQMQEKPTATTFPNPSPCAPIMTASSKGGSETACTYRDNEVPSKDIDSHGGNRSNLVHSMRTRERREARSSPGVELRATGYGLILLEDSRLGSCLVYVWLVLLALPRLSPFSSFT